MQSRDLRSYADIIYGPVVLSIACMIMIGGGRRTARQGIRPEHARVSSILMLAMSAFSLIAVIQKKGNKGRGLIISLGIFALSIETIGILTGYPYGWFEYGEILGYKLGGITPRTVFVGWTPLVITAYYLANNISTNKILQCIISTLILVSFDLVLDPGAVYLGMRYYLYPGIYYGVPWSNFAGRVFSGIIGRCITHLWLGTSRTSDPRYCYTTILNIVFWTTVSGYAHMRIACGIGILRINMLCRHYFARVRTKTSK